MLIYYFQNAILISNVYFNNSYLSTYIGNLLMPRNTKIFQQTQKGKYFSFGNVFDRF